MKELFFQGSSPPPVFNTSFWKKKEKNTREEVFQAILTVEMIQVCVEYVEKVVSDLKVSLWFTYSSNGELSGALVPTFPARSWLSKIHGGL